MAIKAANNDSNDNSTSQTTSHRDRINMPAIPIIKTATTIRMRTAVAIIVADVFKVAGINQV